MFEMPLIAESVLYGKPPQYGFRAVWKTKSMFADIEARDGVTVVAGPAQNC